MNAVFLVFAENIEQISLLVDMVLTFFLVSVAIWSLIYNIKASKEKKRSHIRVTCIQTPDTFEFLYNSKNADVEKIKEQLKKTKILHDERPDGKDVTVKEQNYGELNSATIDDLKKHKNNIYYAKMSTSNNNEPNQLGNSLVLNLITEDENLDEKSDILVCKNQSRISLCNYGAPIHTMCIEKCEIEYTNEKSKEDWNARKPKSMKQKIIMHMDFDKAGHFEKGNIDLSQVTSGKKYALCDIEKLDDKKNALIIGERNFFNYKKIIFVVIIESIYGVETRFRVTLEHEEAGGTLSCVIKPLRRLRVPKKPLHNLPNQNTH